MKTKISVSYPYLSVARDRGLRYGDVLWYVTYLDMVHDHETEQPIVLDRRICEAIERLDSEDRTSIQIVRSIERNRRNLLTL